MRTSIYSVIALAVFGVNATVVYAQAPVPRPDTAVARDTLESVVVRATRAGGATPTSATTLDRATIERTYLGQDAPLALLGITGLTANSDAGPMSGYSSIRLRGVDQSRLAIALDGVPLNDPEDQVLYFSNVPDFMNSMHSVRVQRGVGSSAFGTASFAGSLDFESVPLLTTPRFAEAQVTGGTWGTRRISLEGASGAQGSFAAYARISAKDTDGYRYHSGNRAHSGFFSAGWFGERNALKITGLAGFSNMQPSYEAVSEADLAVDPRTNTNSEDEQDRFRQEMVSVQYTRVLRPGMSLTTTGYRNSAGGWFGEVPFWKIHLDHVWYGALSTLSWHRDDLILTAGAHVSTYERDHFGFFDPDFANRAYDNTGHKQEQSGFVKATWTRGAFDWTCDLQVRRSAFRYEPTPGSTFGEPSVQWIFVNPKVGVTWRAAAGMELFASLGQAGREPKRSDMLVGEEDISDATAPEILPLTRVKPEKLTDAEIGARWQRGTLSFGANAFGMWFQDEIAPIGATTSFGTQLRKNVGRTSRLGMEAEATWRAHQRLLLSSNLMVMRARIAEYTDEATATTYSDVRPLLSPAVVANAQAVWTPIMSTEVNLSLRHVGESPLANDGNAALITPAFTLADLGASYTLGRTALRVQVQNLLDAVAFASGETDGTIRYFFPVASRTVMATVVVTF